MIELAEESFVYDESDWTPEEQLRLLAESGKRAGWDDPEMDVYDNYEQAHAIEKDK